LEKKTKEYVEKNHKGKPVIKVLNEEYGFSKDKSIFIAKFRIMFQVCSFLYQWSEFVLEVTSFDEYRNRFLILFKTIPFKLYARRNGNKLYGAPEIKKKPVVPTIKREPIVPLKKRFVPDTIKANYDQPSKHGYFITRQMRKKLIDSRQFDPDW